MPAVARSGNRYLRQNDGGNPWMLQILVVGNKIHNKLKLIKSTLAVLAPIILLFWAGIFFNWFKN